jgi:hypothetical protein
MSRPHLFIRDDNGVIHDLFLNRFQEYALLKPHVPQRRQVNPSAVNPSAAISVEDFRPQFFPYEFEELGSLVSQPSFSCGLLFTLPIRQIVAKLHKKKNPAGRIGIGYRTRQTDDDYMSDVSEHQTMSSIDLVRPSQDEPTRLGKATNALAKSAKAIMQLPCRVLKTDEEPSPCLEQNNPLVRPSYSKS